MPKKQYGQVFSNNKKFMPIRTRPVPVYNTWKNLSNRNEEFQEYNET